MSNLFTNNEGLQSKGQQFSEYAADLQKLLSEIDNDIAQITGGELKGKAAETLVGSYEEIRDAIVKHIDKINAVGGAVTEIAKARSSIDEEASTAARGTAM